jgi:hypothetical protein
MPNHVHLLITPYFPVRRIMNGLKGSTAREANAAVGRTGKHSWQDESFDWVRNAEEFVRLRTYIEFNPVSAKLASRPEDWLWSSASWKSPLPLEKERRPKINKQSPVAQPCLAVLLSCSLEVPPWSAAALLPLLSTQLWPHF